MKFTSGLFFDYCHYYSSFCEHGDTLGGVSGGWYSAPCRREPAHYRWRPLQWVSMEFPGREARVMIK